MLLMAASRYWLVCQASLRSLQSRCRRMKRKRNSSSDTGSVQTSSTWSSSAASRGICSRSASSTSSLPGLLTAVRTRRAAASSSRRSARITSAREAGSACGSRLSVNAC